jgi:hypothetical protein
MDTPVVILFFNRPQYLRLLLLRLAEVKPKKLYFVCDGPRLDRVGEREKVDECRLLCEDIPWDCQIQKKYAETNLGCRERIISGLDWVFSQEERAVILEDDCIPIVDFFAFAEEMLEVYKDDTRILSVSGTNWCPSKSWDEYSITFSRYAVISGWATWRRAWEKLDRNLEHLQFAEEKHILRAHLRSWRAEWYWLYIIKKKKTSWGYRWELTSFINNGLHVIPRVSLVDNVGMSGSDSTHTTDNPYDWPVPATNFPKPYYLPSFVTANGRLDTWVEDNHFSRSIIGRCRWLIRKLFNIVRRYR